MSWDGRGKRPSNLDRNPGYRGVLPRVFPYRMLVGNGDEGSGRYLIRKLTEAEITGFALTSHSQKLDGSADLWLSVEAAEYLCETMQIVGEEQLIRTENVR